MRWTGYSHHRADHGGASSDKNVVRIGHEETRRLLLRDNDPARLAAADVYTANTTFSIMESMRLDLGYGSQVHP